MHFLPAGCSKEQPTHWRPTADKAVGDELDACTTGHFSPSVGCFSFTLTRLDILLIFSLNFIRAVMCLHNFLFICLFFLFGLVFSGGWRYFGKPNVYPLRPGPRGPAVWESWIAAESPGTLHWPVWHQTCCSAHPPAQPWGRHSRCYALYHQLSHLHELLFHLFSSGNSF